MRTTETMDRVLEQLNSLLRGEISAAETYSMAIQKIAGDSSSAATALRAISQEHGEHAQRLREEIRGVGGDPADSSGAWGAWAKIVQGSADIFGDASAVKALKEGEEHGLKDYQDALKAVDPDMARLVSAEFIPAQQRHIAALDGMLETLSLRRK